MILRPPKTPTAIGKPRDKRGQFVPHVIISSQPVIPENTVEGDDLRVNRISLTNLINEVIYIVNQVLKVG